jgi:hypothetical protein
VLPENTPARQRLGLRRRHRMPDIGDLAIQVRQLVEVPVGDPVNKPEKHLARTQTHKTSQIIRTGSE